jgi:hypothetical protein
MKWLACLLAPMCLATALHGYQIKPAEPLWRSRVILAAPDGVWAGADERGCTVEFLTAGAPAAPMLTPGARVESFEPITIDGCKGRLVICVDDDAPPACLMVATIGEGERSVQITLSFNRARRATLEPAARKALLAARWDRSRPLDPWAQMDFRVTTTARFKVCETGRFDAQLTSTGTWPATSADEPEVRIQMNALLPYLPKDRRAYALAWAEMQFEYQGTIVDIRPITIDGLDGYEVLARGMVAVTPDLIAPQTICQVVLFDGGQVHSLKARLPAALGTWLDEARALMASFRRRV